MKIYIGADHRGYDYKEKIIKILQDLKYKVTDFGVYHKEKNCDYPEIAYQVATHVASTKNSRGILICMSGIGQSIAANKVKGNTITEKIVKVFMMSFKRKPINDSFVS